MSEMLKSIDEKLRRKSEKDYWEIAREGELMKYLEELCK